MTVFSCILALRGGPVPGRQGRPALVSSAPTQLEGFQLGLVGCPDMELVEDFFGMVRAARSSAELGKFDLTDAYKHVLVHPGFWH